MNEGTQMLGLCETKLIDGEEEEFGEFEGVISKVAKRLHTRHGVGIVIYNKLKGGANKIEAESGKKMDNNYCLCCWRGGRKFLKTAEGKIRKGETNCDGIHKCMLRYAASDGPTQ